MRGFALVLAIGLFCVAGLADTSHAQFNISGTVTDTFSSPIDSVRITLSDGLGNPIGIPLILTDPFGAYTIAGLPNGSYIVGFEPKAVDRLLAGTVPVTIAGSNVIADVMLDPGVLLSGFVRDTTGVGIFNIDLKVELKSTGDILNTPGDNTDSTGFYDIVVPADELIVTWRAVDPLLEPWIPVEMRFFVFADTTIDITMVLGVFVGGTVRDNLNNLVVNVNMDFVDAVTGIKLDTNGDVTNLLGMYLVQVPTGTYNVRAKPDPLSHLQGLEIQNVVVTGDTTVDASVVPGLLLSGTVTDPGLFGVENVDIDVRDANGQEFYTAFSATGIGGLYQFVVPSGILGLTYEPDPLTLLVPVDFPAVPVLLDTIINVTLATGVTLDGSVTKAVGGAVANVDIDLRTVPGNISVPLVGDRTDALGNFTVVVAPGTYDVEVEPPLSTNLVALLDTAVPILSNTVDAYVVETGAHVSGTTTDSASTIIPDVSVTVFDLIAGQPVLTPTGKSDAAGHYDIVVPKSNHRMTFRTDPLSGIIDSVIVDDNRVTVNQILNVMFGLSVATGIADTPIGARTAFSNIYPNPFNPTATIRFHLRETANVEVHIISVNGATVRRLFEGEKRVGQHQLVWDGRTDTGQAAASGVYFVRLRAGNEILTRRAVLLK